MIEHNLKDMQIIQSAFPNLYYNKESNDIRGEINIAAYYVQNDKGEWLIKQCEPSNTECIVDSYNIKICLNEYPPKVFELEERIKRLYYENKHLFIDDSCCLGIFLPNANETLSDFVIEKVYPYFVWHAYFEKYGKKPPCGEYSHARGYEEFLEDHSKSIPPESIPSKSIPSKSIASLHAEWLAIQPLSEENNAALWEWIRMQCNHYSNRIEGNPLTYDEANTLFKKQNTSGHELRQYKEMEAHNEAFEHVRILASTPQSITEADIRDINKICLKEPFYKDAQTEDGQPTRKKVIPGEYKKQPNHVRLAQGGIFTYGTPVDVPILMGDLVVWIREQLAIQEQLPKNNDEQIKILVAFLAELHRRFILIHPFDDGNGRTIRLLINYVLILLDFLPIDVKHHSRYINAVECSDTGDISHLEKLFADNITAMLERGILAKNKRIDINEK